MDKLKLVFIILSFCLFQINISQAEPNGDYLYSDEYFDYLIECATREDEIVQNEDTEEIPLDNDQVTAFEFDETIEEVFEPFKLGIRQTVGVDAYSETFIKEDTKTIIPVGNKFSFIQDTYKYRNKYNSDDYRILAGAEFKPWKNFNIASGLETNYRGFDQNPTSRKLYFTPTLKINDKLSLSFFNKYNVNNYSSDHDISVNISPFKSKAVDFKVYAGITKQQSGAQSRSVNFYTNFYLF